MRATPLRHLVAGDERCEDSAVRKAETIEVRVRGFGGGESRATLTVERYEKGERVRRGFVGLGWSWLAAAGAIFIPGLHFILVPVLLLAGPIIFLVRSRRASAVTGGSGSCPECGATFSIVRGREEWPLLEICDACRRHLRIERITGSVDLQETS